MVAKTSPVAGLMLLSAMVSFRHGGADFAKEQLTSRFRMLHANVRQSRDLRERRREHCRRDLSDVGLSKMQFRSGGRRIRSLYLNGNEHAMHLASGAHTFHNLLAEIAALLEMERAGRGGRLRQVALAD